MLYLQLVGYLPRYLIVIRENLLYARSKLTHMKLSSKFISIHMFLLQFKLVKQEEDERIMARTIKQLSFS